MTHHALHNLWLTIFTVLAINSFQLVHASWLNKIHSSTLPDGVDHVVAACQEDNLFLECRNRYNKLLIKEVFYGRDNTFTCASKVADSSKLCTGQTPSLVADKLNLMCAGENKCKVPVTPEFLEKKGDEICADVRKYLRVSYSCHQEPQLNMVCHNGCSNSCWPSCKKSCCAPAPPPPVTTTCSGSCPSSCAPLCTYTCCQSDPEPFQLPSIPTLCPGDCPSDCAPRCDASCCNNRKTTASQFNQPPPTIQYDRIRPSTCGSMCTPAQCLSTCDPACCNSQITAVQTAAIQTPIPPQLSPCPVGCSSQCAPSCEPSCCQGTSMMQYQPPPPPSPPPPAPSQPQYCPVGCSQQCAPLCQPTCCQSTPVSQIPVSQIARTCGAGCSQQCAPLCQPTCCQSMGAPMAPMTTAYAPQPQMQQPLLQQPMQQPMQQPIQMPMMPALPQQKGCPVNCLMACLPRCPRRCCITGSTDAYSQNGVSRELQQRKTYQQMLQRFRTKQLQQYSYGN